MTEKQAGESGLNCGGSVQIYTEQIAGDALEYYRQIAAARLARRPCALVTVLAAQPDLGKMLLFADDRPPLGGGRLLERAIAKQGASVLEQDRGKLVDLTPEKGAESRFGLAAGTRLQAFVEPFLPPPVLYVFGGGHVGGQVARLAKGVGFNVVIVDDRPLFASSQRHPYADQCLVEPMEGVCQRLPIDDQSYIVAATRGHQHDEIVIEQAIDTPARYIGMLGSERKKMILWQRIEARGAQRSQLDRVFAPIGFNIGADTPEEIAVSVTAELIQVRRGPRKVWKTKSAELVV